MEVYRENLLFTTIAIYRSALLFAIGGDRCIGSVYPRYRLPMPGQHRLHEESGIGNVHQHHGTAVFSSL